MLPKFKLAEMEKLFNYIYNNAKKNNSFIEDRIYNLIDYITIDIVYSGLESIHNYDFELHDYNYTCKVDFDTLELKVFAKIMGLVEVFSITIPSKLK